MLDVRNKNITVLGAARSGIAAARLLSKLNANVFVSDNAKEENKVEEIDLLKGLGIPFEFGKHSDKIFNSDFVVLSPGIPVVSTIVQKILYKGIPIFSEIEFSSWYCKSPMIAVTGSNGKTTTVTLIGQILKTEQPQRIQAGNIGDPFAAQVINSIENNWAVIEVSSFQLETIDEFHPKVAAILNLAPNHLDRYDGNYEKYITAKLRILKNLKSNDYIIYNLDDELLVEKIKKCESQKISFSSFNKSANAYLKGSELMIENEVLINVGEIKLNGIHNYMNIMAASLACQIAGISNESIRYVLKEFSGVEHRLEFVKELNGIRYVNDSKATTIDSLAVALNSFKNPIVLIAGGKDKGSDFSKLNNLIEEFTREVILIGSAKEKIFKNWASIKPVHFADTLEDAVHLATIIAHEKDTVLFSPACASFDMFKDYEDRGKQFKSIVNRLI
jgi:UDP-N-acetylmuramoylalanine--D-glutamate ligase